MVTVRSKAAPGLPGSARQRATAASHAAPAGDRGRPARYWKVTSSGAITRARPGPASIDMLQTVDRFFHRERADGAAGVLDDVPDAARDPDAGDDGEDRRPWPRRPDAGDRRPGPGGSAAAAAAGTAWRGRAPPRRCRCRTRAPRSAPCVLVWLSPQTMVVPGCVRPSSAPITCTMPCCSLCSECSSTPNSAQLLLSSAESCAAHSWSLHHEPLPRLPGGGGDGVVHRRHRPLRPGTWRPVLAQHREGLRRRHLVDQVQIDVHARRPSVSGRTRRVPDLREQRARTRAIRTTPDRARQPSWKPRKEKRRRRGRRRWEDDAARAPRASAERCGTRTRPRRREGF